MDGVSPFEPTLVGAVRREWRVVVAIIVALVIPVGLFAVARPKTYTATASLTVGDPTGPGVLGAGTLIAPDRYVTDQLAVVDSADFGAAAKSRGLQQKPPLRKPATWFIAHTSAGADAQNSNLLKLSFSAPTAAEAMSGVRADVAAYSDVIRAAAAARARAVGAQLDAQIKDLDARLQLLGASSDPLANDKIQQLNNQRGPLVARRAQVATEVGLPDDGVGQTLLPSAASTTGKSAVLRLVVLALAFALLLGVAIAYVRAYRRRVFTEARDPELVLGAPLLSDLSSIGLDDLLIRSSKKAPFRSDETTEAMFGIAANLVAEQLREIEEGGVSLAVVDAENDAGCSAVAWRLALAFAAHDLRVLLIAADGSWSPPAEWIAHAADRYTWTEHSDGTVALSDWCSFASGRSLPTKARNNGSSVTALPVSFCPEPPLRSQRAMSALFSTLEQEYDLVLVDAAPFVSSPAAASLTSAAGRALAVVRAQGGVSDHEELARRLQLAAAVTIGYVYCGRDAKVAESWPGPKLEELYPTDADAVSTDWGRVAGANDGSRAASPDAALPERPRASRSGWAGRAYRADS